MLSRIEILTCLQNWYSLVAFYNSYFAGKFLQKHFILAFIYAHVRVCLCVVVYLIDPFDSKTMEIAAIKLEDVNYVFQRS